MPISPARIKGIRMDWGVLLPMLLLPTCGLVVLYSAGYDPEWSGVRIGWIDLTLRSQAFVRQLMFLAAALIVATIAFFLNVTFLHRITYLLYGLGIVLLVAVALGGTVVNGSRRWLDFGPIALQPSEMMKLATILTLARYISRTPPGRGGYSFKQLIFPALILLLPMIIIARQPDLGTALALGAAGGGMLLFAGIRSKTVAITALVAVAAIYPAWHALEGYQQRRILVLIDPQVDPLGSGYHIIQSKIAVGSGQLFGKGYFNGTQSQLEFLPEHTTDFVFSVLAEEWGFVGCAVVLSLYFILIASMLRALLRVRDLYQVMAIFGVAMLLFFHVMVNMGMVMGIFPVVGIPLPLFSYGGSAALTNLAAMGVVAGMIMKRQVYTQ